jgi:hypothetical protein
MEIILNRWRGTGVIFTSIPYIKGVHFYAIYIGLLFGFLSTYYYGLLALILFLIGESFAWGKWVGSLCHPENITDEVKNGKCGKSFPYIHYMANYIQNQDKDYKLYCQIALAIRGLIWWTPIMILLGCINLLGWYQVVINSIILSIGFPIACEIGKNINFECNYKYFNTSKGWCNQELIYGFIQFLCITFSIFLFAIIK